MRIILSYIKVYKGSAVIALLLMLLELVVELLQPLIMGIIIDRGVLRQDLSAVAGWGGLLLGLSLLAFIAGITNSFFAANVSQGVARDVREAMFKRIQYFIPAQLQKFSLSTLLTRMTSDVTQLQSLLFMAMRIMLRAPLFILFGLVMAIIVEPSLATVLLLAVPLLLGCMVIVMVKGVKRFRSVQTNLDQVNHRLRENLFNMRLVKAYDRGEFEQKQFEEANGPLQVANTKALRLMETTMPMIMFGMNMSLIAILWVGSYQLNGGGTQPGEVVSVLNYGMRIMFSFGVFSFLIMLFSRGRASISRIVSILEEYEGNDRNQDGSSYQSGAVAFNHVSFNYPTRSAYPALEDISFTVPRGKMLGILGETGSGKTTLAQLIPRLYQPVRGTISFGGIDSQDIRVEDLREKIGVVPQEAHLFSGTIRENLLWGNKEATMEDLIQSTKDAGIYEFIKELPDGFETTIGQKGVNFSGGQKQRICIARALMKRPDILVLDDSTSALDAKTESDILNKLTDLPYTVFIIAQKISSVKEADQLLLLHEGKMQGVGNHKELLASNEFYQTLYQSQQKKGEVHYVENS
ncbi:ABC transporter ATP-binding protein [Pontibacillus chungwhensis BH030062]|uniref:ABC transporter ATP-binding protein n=1 Tax=Pontibacillus chungwhensis BH030062 TaxID=1385513 RepID=A0A0A2UWC8_9BACI|nr:ABC transporter ATP-binding protein [Pontibacillus chungwhensis]KGP92607.1 ABC transporter ATP-binding protein [Pontibacillus chungwhensis BH030062]